MAKFISINDPVHFMWNSSSLKSRDCFLMILEFVNVYRLKLQSILGAIKPSGAKFYDKYIESNYQFTKHDFRYSEEAIVNAKEALRNFNFVPSEEHIRSLTKDFLRDKCGLSRIDYNIG